MPFTKEQPQEYVTQCSYCSFVLIGEVGGSSFFCVSSFLLLLGSSFLFSCSSVLQRWGIYLSQAQFFLLTVLHSNLSSVSLCFLPPILLMLLHF